jgi:hypothetical protein
MAILIRSIRRAAVKVTAILGQRAHCPVVDFSLKQDDALLKKRQGLWRIEGPSSGNGRKSLRLHSQSSFLKRSAQMVILICHADQAAAQRIYLL